MAKRSSSKNVGDLHRLLGELVLLRGHEPCTPTTLARKFGVSEKTIRRDIKKLSGTGFPVKFDRATARYRVESGTFLPAVQLTLDEALALIVICEDVAGRGQVSLLDPALGAMTKIESLLPQALRDELATVMDFVEVRLARSGGSGAESGHFATLRDAIVTQTVLRCQYRSLRGESPERSFEFEPYALWYGVRAWYVIGKHRRRGEVRALKLRRFLRIDRTATRFTRPRDFSVEAHLGNAWQMIRGSTEYDVELHFDAEFAETICETLWHKTQRVERLADGSALVKFRVAGLDEIVWWVLSMGGHCRVLAPRELADRVSKEAEAIRAKHSPPAKPRRKT
ncbi:MAG: helix-turn-helix transcriptional regulator [Phycisphaerae bacterium]|jgi:predicted DNA-binding transcriptional regulator YafY